MCDDTEDHTTTRVSKVPLEIPQARSKSLPSMCVYTGAERFNNTSLSVQEQTTRDHSGKQRVKRLYSEV